MVLKVETQGTLSHERSTTCRVEKLALWSS